MTAKIHIPRGFILCADGDHHLVTLFTRRVKCSREKCQICQDLGGHGPYTFAGYRSAMGPRCDYIGLAYEFTKSQRGKLVKTKEVACPTPGCKQVVPVKLNKNGRPTYFCPECRHQGMVRGEKGARMWIGEDIVQAAAPVESAIPAAAVPAKKKNSVLDDIL